MKMTAVDPNALSGLKARLNANLPMPGMAPPGLGKGPPMMGGGMYGGGGGGGGVAGGGGGGGGAPRGGTGAMAAVEDGDAMLTKTRNQGAAGRRPPTRKPRAG